jgi:DNA polymerase/3'-5' exonuclease PolX
MKPYGNKSAVSPGWDKFNIKAFKPTIRSRPSKIISSPESEDEKPTRKSSSSSIKVVKTSSGKPVVEESSSSSSIKVVKKPNRDRIIVEESSSSSSIKVVKTPFRKTNRRISPSASEEEIVRKPFTPSRKISPKSSSPSSKTVRSSRKIKTPSKIASSSSSVEEVKIHISNREEIIKLLKEIISYYEVSEDPKDLFKIKAFNNGINVLTNYDGKITRKDLEKTKLGPHTIDEILEIAETGESARLNKLRKNNKKKPEEDEEEQEKKQIITELSTIKYIKKETAEKLYKEGVKSIADLRKKVKSGEIDLSKAQRLALKYYDDLKERIPRDEMDKWKALFAKLLDSNTDDDFKWDLVGSYRRGMPSSSDLDLIITDRENKDIIKILERKDILVDIISNGNHSSIVLVRLNDESLVRQLDITNFGPDEYIYGLLHTTGSAEHVVQMQLRAKEMGYTVLNTYGLYDKKSKPVLANSEEDIFKLLKLKYQTPEERVNKVIPK